MMQEVTRGDICIPLCKSVFKDEKGNFSERYTKKWAELINISEGYRYAKGAVDRQCAKG